MEVSSIYGLIPDSLRITADQAAELAAQDRSIYGEFFRLSIDRDDVWAMRASRVTNFASVINRDFYLEIRPELIGALPSIANHSVQRNLMKTIIDCGIPNDEENLGIIVSYAFKILETGPMIPGIQVYAMELLLMASERYTDLEDELMAHLESRLDDDSAGIRCRADQIIRRIRKRQRRP